MTQINESGTKAPRRLHKFFGTIFGIVIGILFVSVPLIMLLVVFSVVKFLLTYLTS